MEILLGYLIAALLLSWIIVAFTPTPFQNLWIYFVITAVFGIIFGILWFSKKVPLDKSDFRTIQWSSLMLVVLPLFLASVATWPNAPEETKSVQFMMVLFNIFNASSFVFGWFQARKQDESRIATFFGFFMIFVFVILLGLTILN
jgi:biotin transporter BioY